MANFCAGIVWDWPLFLKHKVVISTDYKLCAYHANSKVNLLSEICFIVLLLSLYLPLFNKWPVYLIENLVEKIMSYHRLLQLLTNLLH